MSTQSELLKMGPDQPFDHWPTDRFDNHRAAENIELHAHRRMGGPPIFLIAICGMAANAILNLVEQEENSESEQTGK